LFDPDPELLTLSVYQQSSILKALRALSVYAGCSELFKRMKAELGLKWKKYDSMALVRSILEERVSWSDVLDRLSIIRMLGWRYYFPIAFAALTGLRRSEVFWSLEIVGERGLHGYFNEELSALEHFRFPEIFLRRTKNAYLSFISPRVKRLLETFQEKVSPEAIECKLRKRGLNGVFRLARKAWATEMRKILPTELVDLLQGRVPGSVFTRYYYRPDLREAGKKVLEALKPLEDRLLPAQPPELASEAGRGASRPLKKDGGGENIC